MLKIQKQKVGATTPTYPSLYSFMFSPVRQSDK